MHGDGSLVRPFCVQGRVPGAFRKRFACPLSCPSGVRLVIIEARMVAHLAEQIRKRAIQVGTLGVYLGLWDMLIYAMFAKRRVLAWFGERQVDLVNFLCPAKAGQLEADAPVIQVVGTRVSEYGVEPVDAAQSLNHWLAASELLNSEEYKILATSVPPDANVHELFLEAFPTEGDLADIEAFSRNFGHNIHKTTSQGDCGIDALACCEGRPRNLVEWGRLRAELM